jgi:hypothetical protein
MGFNFTGFQCNLIYLLNFKINNLCFLGVRYNLQKFYSYIMSLFIEKLVYLLFKILIKSYCLKEIFFLIAKKGFFFKLIFLY